VIRSTGTPGAFLALVGGRAAQRTLRNRRDGVASATIRKDESPEGERRLDGCLEVLGLKDGNGLRRRTYPGCVKSANEDGSRKPNGPDGKSRIALKR
jgi:hypothetical protein